MALVSIVDITIDKSALPSNSLSRSYWGLRTRITRAIIILPEVSLFRDHSGRNHTHSSMSSSDQPLSSPSSSAGQKRKADSERSTNPSTVKDIKRRANLGPEQSLLAKAQRSDAQATYTARAAAKNTTEYQQATEDGRKAIEEAVSKATLERR